MRRSKNEYSYQINLIPDEEGGYTVVVPLTSGLRLLWGDY